MADTRNRLNQLFEALLGITEIRKVDYKAQQYDLSNERKKSQFVKDILCIANAPGADGHILLGVKTEKGEVRKVIGISNHHDSSDLEQIVASVVEEPIHFEYYPFNYAGQKCGLLHIPASNARPHWAKNDFGLLKKHIFYTRRASGNREASFAEIREMFLAATRVSEVAQHKLRSSRHIVDELVDMSLDDRKLAMHKMLKNIASKANLREYRSIMSNFFNRREQEFALVKSSSGSAIHEFSVFVYPWNVKRDEIIWSRRKVLDFLTGSRTMKVASQLKKRLEQSSLIHISYKRIYTTSLEKWPYSSRGYFFANEWSEPWGKVVKWEDLITSWSADGKITPVKKAKYEFFVPDVTSQDELRDRLEKLLLWVDSNVK